MIVMTPPRLTQETDAHIRTPVVASTPVVAGGVLYISNRTHLFAIEQKEE